MDRQALLWGPLRHGPQGYLAGLHQGRRARGRCAEARSVDFAQSRDVFCINGVLIEAKDLVNGVSIVQIEHAEEVEYFHIELESHDVILAEGRWRKASSMTTAAACSTMPMSSALSGRGDRAPPTARRDAIAVMSSRRSGSGSPARRPAAHAITPCRWLGARFCRSDHRRRVIEGWAQNIDHPEAPIRLDIRAGSRVIGQVLANRYRPDLKRAGIGSGYHSFAFTLPDGLAFASNAVEVRRSLDGAVLPVSEHAKRIGVSAAA